MPWFDKPVPELVFMYLRLMFCHQSFYESVLFKKLWTKAPQALIHFLVWLYVLNIILTGFMISAERQTLGGKSLRCQYVRFFFFFFWRMILPSEKCLLIIIAASVLAWAELQCWRSARMPVNNKQAFKSLSAVFHLAEQTLQPSNRPEDCGGSVFKAQSVKNVASYFTLSAMFFLCLCATWLWNPDLSDIKQWSKTGGWICYVLI